MRTWVGRTVGLIAAIAAFAPAAFAADDLGPDVRYWPLREIHFPVPVEKIQSTERPPTKLRFYAAPNRGQFKMAAERAIANLDVIDADRNKRGFKYSSPADGEYDFALQFVFADNETQPRESELVAQYRIVFDTRPPAVRVATLGAYGVEWDVQDENPDPDGIRLEVRWQGTTKWTTAKTGRALNLRDQYTWQGLKTDQPLEVRVIARDKAGSEMASRILTLPSASGGQGLPAGFSDPRRGGGRDDAPGRPQIEYVPTRSFTVESKLSKVTRSGVKSAHLWVNDGGRNGWRLDREHPVTDIGPETADPTVHLPFTAPKDGLYGFIVIPENFAGGKQENPRPTDSAQILVEVDTERPFVKVKAVRVSPGGLAGPRVEIEWEASDKNLLSEPITLEYSESPSGPWLPISKERLTNTSRYVWEVEDTKLWKFYVRARAEDLALNRSENIYESGGTPKAVIIDLEKPSAEPVKVHAGAGQARSSERRGPVGVSPVSAPPPTAPEVSNPSPPPSPSPSSSPPLSPSPSSAPLLPSVTPVTLPSDGGLQPIPILPPK